jgi:hypothetical protein
MFRLYQWKQTSRAYARGEGQGFCGLLLIPKARRCAGSPQGPLPPCLQVTILEMSCLPPPDLKFLEETQIWSKREVFMEILWLFLAKHIAMVYGRGSLHTLWNYIRMYKLVLSRARRGSLTGAEKRKCSRQPFFKCRAGKIGWQNLWQNLIFKFTFVLLPCCPPESKAQAVWGRVQGLLLMMLNVTKWQQGALCTPYKIMRLVKTREEGEACTE